MARFAILSALVLAGVFVTAPARAAENDCFVPIPGAPKDTDPAFHKARIAGCTELLRSELTPETRLQALGNRAQSYFYLRAYVRVLLDLQQTMAIVPDSPEPIFDLGLAYQGLGYSALALPRIDEGIRGGNNTASALANKAFAEAGLGKYEEAIADANLALDKDNSSTSAYAARAMSEEQLGQMSDAVQDFNKAIAGAADEATLYHYRGVALYGLDRYREALDDLDHADRLIANQNSHGFQDEIRAILAAPETPAPSPADGSAPVRAVGRTHNCSAYFPYLPVQLGEHGDVILRYDVSAAGTISNATVEQSSGNVTLDRAAVVCVNAHWRSTPAMQEGKPVATQQRAKIVFVQDPSDLRLPMRAATLAALGRYDDAIAIYTEYLAQASSDAEAYFQRGFLRYLKADYAAAVKDFDKAVALKPDFDDAKAGRELVQPGLLPRKPRQDI